MIRGEQPSEILLHKGLNGLELLLRLLEFFECFIRSVKHRLNISAHSEFAIMLALRLLYINLFIRKLSYDI